MYEKKRFQVRKAHSKKAQSKINLVSPTSREEIQTNSLFNKNFVNFFARYNLCIIKIYIYIKI